MPDYIVQQGDCISSIAVKYGYFWDKVWNHPKNAKLKEKRKDPNVLFPGDIVYIPEKEKKEESCITEKCHRFKKKGEPAKLRLRLLNDEDKPRAGISYILDIDGKLFQGTTDGDGKLEHPIPPNARQGRLIITETEDEYPLHLGFIDPIDKISGIQSRLNNLGFDCGIVDGILGSKTEAAIKIFQKKYNLQETGKDDEATKNKLLEIHGC